ncbi:ImmA/IrrE family metallo-endopeptidase [Sporolactobacillus sp. STSJ-5]|uniref:ImmA/IrrE family metallo-endopeptidase n=1 Tax=Sporolactobacillus sp. STSJ-5 TaxID=2965076 RepID=UPI0021021B16|nr:ImmA/IrrE family metallo-endopeptidase [Sporolactobacillus sp. STSJ-5]MCQ2010587.1 ImmA/IrrE family metallo-endopeptidase [Sporolactobacillus sp. STSJ-5]
MYCKTELEDYVLSLYKSLGLTWHDGPLLNEVAERLNIEIIHSPFHSQALRIGGRVRINLNINLEMYADQWETFGHELHHALIDVGNQALFPFPLRQLREQKAQNFALHFCIPTFRLEHLHWPERDAAPFIAEKFRVTLPFASKRLEQYRNRILQNQIDDYAASVAEPAIPFQIDKC